MRHVSLLVPLVLSALLLSACADRPTGESAPAPAIPPTVAEAPPVGDTSANALDWAGRYTGTLPCADCEGIETTLVLSDDQNYLLRSRYLGKGDEVFETQGSFRWDAAGRTIQLDGIEGGIGHYLVGENQLFHLDSDGQRIDGPLADHYRLLKQVVPNVDPELIGQRWQLVEWMGQAVKAPSPTQHGTTPFIVFDAEGGVSGHGGCNGFFGGYRIDAPTRLRFEGIGATLMACPDMQGETAFFEALGTVDNYAVGEGRLSLHRARMAPLLRFEAVSATDD